MLRVAVLATSVLLLVASGCHAHHVDQRGTAPTPRAPLDDGQPMTGYARLEVHGAVTAASPFDEPADEPARAGHESGAAAARKQAGASVRVHGPGSIDLTFGIDGSWSPSARSTTGAPIDAPREAAFDLTTGVRIPIRVTETARLGVAIDVGASSVPVRLDDRGRIEDGWAPLGRIALVPSVRRGGVTVFGIAGLASEVYVPPSFTYQPGEGGGPKVDASGPAVVVAAGAALDLGDSAHFTARIGDAFSDDVAAGHYGAQVDLGLSFDLDR